MAETTDNSNSKILLAGNVSGAFLDYEAAGNLSCDNCEDIFDAVELAGRNEYALIGVVMSGTAGNLSSALKALRNVSGRAKIILLAQMYHEPLAMMLVGPDSEGKSLADDYLICPIVAGDFDRWLGKDVLSREPVVARAIVEDGRLADKIRKLEKMATEDDLTCLKNRRYIWEFARQIIEHAKEQDGRVTLLVFDIDNFKQYNDRYGHPTGDALLAQAASLIKKCCRRHDVVGRIGGDEFAVVFWDDPKRKDAASAERRSSSEHPKEAVFIAERFRKQLEDTDFDLLGPGGKGELSISGGLASYPRDGRNVEELFKKADEALLKAKAGGKNQIYLVGTPGK